MSFFPWKRGPAEPVDPNAQMEPAPAGGLRLKFERKGLNVHITLESEADRRKAQAVAAPPAPEAHAAVPAAAEGSPTHRMQTRLLEMLQRHPGARSVLRELALFERLLFHGGERAFTTSPIALLKFAMAQLDSVQAHGDDRDLMALRSHLARALVEREALAHGQGGVPLISDFMDERRLKVSEASASDFAKAEACWPAPGVTPNVKPG